LSGILTPFRKDNAVSGKSKIFYCITKNYIPKIWTVLFPVIHLSQLNDSTMRATGEINQNFKIKVNGKNFNGKSISKLVGVRGLVALVGEELAEKFVERAFTEGADVTTCKLRRGLTVRFYSF